MLNHIMVMCFHHFSRFPGNFTTMRFPLSPLFVIPLYLDISPWKFSIIPSTIPLLSHDIILNMWIFAWQTVSHNQRLIDIRYSYLIPLLSHSTMNHHYPTIHHHYPTINHHYPPLSIKKGHFPWLCSITRR